MKAPGPDFRAVFESLPGLTLVLTPGPDFIIEAVSDTDPTASMTRREVIIGRSVFDAFPDNPDDPQASGVSNILHQVEDVTPLMHSTQPLGKREASRRMLQQARESEAVFAVIFDRSPSFMAVTVGPTRSSRRASSRGWRTRSVRERRFTPTTRPCA